MTGNARTRLAAHLESEQRAMRVLSQTPALGDVDRALLELVYRHRLSDAEIADLARQDVASIRAYRERIVAGLGPTLREPPAQEEAPPISTVSRPGTAARIRTRVRGAAAPARWATLGLLTLVAALLVAAAFLGSPERGDPGGDSGLGVLDVPAGREHQERPESDSSRRGEAEPDTDARAVAAVPRAAVALANTASGFFLDAARNAPLPRAARAPKARGAPTTSGRRRSVRGRASTPGDRRGSARPPAAANPPGQAHARDHPRAAPPAHGRHRSAVRSPAPAAPPATGRSRRPEHSRGRPHGAVPVRPRGRGRGLQRGSHPGRGRGGPARR